MKALLVTITATAVVPEGHMPTGLTVPDFAYRCVAGLMNLQTLTAKARPATREETERSAAFLADWALCLSEFEFAMEADKLPGIAAAGNFGREMTIEQPADGKAGA